MYHRLFPFYLLFLISPHVQGYDAWAGGLIPKETWGGSYSIVMDYTITGSASPSQNTVACTYPRCIFAPMPRTGLGPSGSWCDAGGVCNGDVVKDGVTIKQGTTWNDAFAAFIKKYRASGTFTMRNYSTFLGGIRWDAICVGFATLPNDRTSISVLAPGTVCGSIPKPDLNCTVNLPGLVDLGTVVVGTSGATGSASGGVECSQKASVTGSLLNNPQIDGHDVKIDINGLSMGNSAVVVGTGTIVPLLVTATIPGTLRNAGSYSSDAILQISYH